MSDVRKYLLGPARPRERFPMREQPREDFPAAKENEPPLWAYLHWRPPASVELTVDNATENYDEDVQVEDGIVFGTPGPALDYKIRGYSMRPNSARPVARVRDLMEPVPPVKGIAYRLAVPINTFDRVRTVFTK